MKEIELKFLIPDFSVVYTRLRAINAKLVHSGAEYVTYYDNLIPDVSLRVKRFEGRAPLLTLKRNTKKDEGVKVCEEYNASITEEEIQKLIEFFKPVPSFEYKKRREHWEIDEGVFVELDSLEDGQHFVEIEAGSKEEIFDLARVLGIENNESTTDSYPKLVRFIYHATPQD